jgi:PTS system ascorbate-specific IIA component
MALTMKDMLKRENVQIVESCGDWKDAVRIAVQPLVDGGYVKPEYIDGIIENAEKLGPYFVLVPDLALLHARPEQGVIKKQLAITVLRHGVEFKKGEPCRVLVTLAAEDSDSHIDVMKILANMFADPAIIKAAATAETPDDIFKLFIEFPSN